jgi:hypothetical protein
MAAVIRNQRIAERGPGRIAKFRVVVGANFDRPATGPSSPPCVSLSVRAGSTASRVSLACISTSSWGVVETAWLAGAVPSVLPSGAPAELLSGILPRTSGWSSAPSLSSQARPSTQAYSAWGVGGAATCAVALSRRRQRWGDSMVAVIRKQRIADRGIATGGGRIPVWDSAAD